MLKKFLNSRYKALIFDCDGTIADTMSLYYRSWNLAIRELNGPVELSWQEFKANGGRCFKDSVRLYNERCGTHLSAESIIRSLEHHMRRLLPYFQPIAPVVDLIRAEQSKQMAVASSGTREAVHYILNRLEIKDKFNSIVTQEDVKNVKPAPDLFLLAAEQLKVDPKDCIVFEDSPLGIEAAQIAGMESFLIPTEWWNESLLTDFLCEDEEEPTQKHAEDDGDFYIDMPQLAKDFQFSNNSSTKNLSKKKD